MLLCGALLLIPLLALRHGSKQSAVVHTDAFAPASVTHDALPRASRSNHRILAAAVDDAPVIVTIPPTTEPPVVTTAVTAAPVRAAVRRRPAPTTTTTAKPKPKPTTTTTRPSSSSAPSGSSTSADAGDGHTGKASWYEGAPPGTCAHKTLPKGTVVTVTDLKTGKSVQCTVADRGPYVEGYIIDLSKDTFEKLAPLSQGIVNARIDW